MMLVVVILAVALVVEIECGPSLNESESALLLGQWGVVVAPGRRWCSASASDSLGHSFLNQ